MKLFGARSNNIIFKKYFRNFPEELILPFLWAQDGFSQPSKAMSEKIKFGLEAPGKMSTLGGVGLIVLGGALILATLVWLLITKRNSSGLTFPSPGR